MDLFKTVCASARVPQVRGELAKQLVLSWPMWIPEIKLRSGLAACVLRANPLAPQNVTTITKCLAPVEAMGGRRVRSILKGRFLKCPWM